MRIKYIAKLFAICMPGIISDLMIPKNDIDNSDYYRPNFISLLQSRQSNEVLKSVGRIGVSPNYPTPFLLINRNNLSDPILLKTMPKVNFG